MFWGGEKMNIQDKKFELELERTTRCAEMLKVLAHPMRLCIMRGLIFVGGCNVTHMQEHLQIPQSTISQHLVKLRTAGLIEGVRDGVEVHYHVVSEEAERIVRCLFSS